MRLFMATLAVIGTLAFATSAFAWEGVINNQGKGEVTIQQATKGFPGKLSAHQQLPYSTDSKVNVSYVNKNGDGCLFMVMGGQSYASSFGQGTCKVNGPILEIFLPE